MTIVVVTGGTGYVGTHCVAELLRQGYHVRATVRDAKKEALLKDALKQAAVDPEDRIEYMVADLQDDSGWAEVMQGATYVCHVASPVPSSQNPHAESMIATAVEGTKRVLKFASESKSVKRVVQTSSSAAVTASKVPKDIYTEDDFSDESTTKDAYIKSKAKSERAAWEFVRSKNNMESSHPIELVVLNPVGIYGPVYDRSKAPSSVIIIDFFAKGKLKWVCPDVAYGIVDVRDVAKLHILAMEKPEAKNERFILSESEKVYSLVDIANMMKPELTQQQISNLPKSATSSYLIRALSYIVPPLRASVPLLGLRQSCSLKKAQEFFDWTPIPAAESVAASTRDLLNK